MKRALVILWLLASLPAVAGVTIVRDQTMRSQAPNWTELGTREYPWLAIATARLLVQGTDLRQPLLVRLNGRIEVLYVRTVTTTEPLYYR